MPTFDIVLTKDESGWWVATVPALPGCISQGRSKDEARRNIREAIGLHVDEFGSDADAEVEAISLTRVRTG